MPSKERILESLLDPSARSVARSRPELLSTLLRCARFLGEGAGTSALLALGRRLQRVTLRPGMATIETSEAAAPTSELIRQLTLHGHPIAVPDVAHDPRLGPGERPEWLDAGPGLFLPVRSREQMPGYLAVYRERGEEAFTSEEVRLLTLLAAWGAMALENRRLAESVEKLAVTDDLTQVYNYRFLKTALRREIKRAGRFRQHLGIIMIDVDNLKGYNDRHGHMRGSFLLREMAGLLSEQVRSWDLVAKYGGDEFTIILPQTAGDGCLVAAERLRAAIEGHAFPLAARGEITISLGVACFPQDGDTASGLIQAADRALYLAKRRGRNRIEHLGRIAA